MPRGVMTLGVVQLLLLLALSPADVSVNAVPVIFYPFGTDQGDAIAPVNDDGYTSAIPIQGVGFPFFATIQQQLFVNTNGDLSFSDGFGSYTPTPFPLLGVPMVAPFWTDVDTRMNNGRVYYRQSTNAALLSRASSDIRETFSTSGFDQFSATWVFITTWYNVTFYGGSTTTPTNTFQCVLITNGVNSFAMYNYDRLTWTTGIASGGNASGLGGTPAQVGFNYGDATTYYAVPASRTDAILYIYQQSNIGVNGRWIFRVDEQQIASAGCLYTPDCTLDPRTGLCAGSGLCGYHGDPHYTSFDARRYDYMGVCKHLLVGQVNGTVVANLTFQVYGRNEYRNGVTQVSWYRDVEIVYGGATVQMAKSVGSMGALVKVNGATVKLPYCMPLYTIFYSGNFVRYQTPFGLVVETDGFNAVNIYVPPFYRSISNGLCGNFDGLPSNDLVYNGVDYSSDPSQFGDKYVVSDPEDDNTTSCQTSSIPPSCSPLPPSYETRCQQLININGPFGSCIVALDNAVPGSSTTIYNNCLLDACFNDDSMICEHVFTLVEECAFRGFEIDCQSWQTATECPVVCPAGMVYECNSDRVCMPTCDNPIVSPGCTRPQKGVCVCPMGTLLYNETCTASCPLGCVDGNNDIHPIGDVWTMSDCSQYTCQACPSCPYGSQIVLISTCSEIEVCNSDHRCVTTTTTTTTTTSTTPRPPMSFMNNVNGRQ